MDRRDDPRARTYIVDHVAPGTTVTRALEVSRPLRPVLLAGAAAVLALLVAALAVRSRRRSERA